MKKRIFLTCMVILLCIMILAIMLITRKPKLKDEEGYYVVTSTINQAEATYCNPIIPKGFRPIQTATSDWIFENNSITTENLYAGLVIEDKEGNQFVWIPVDQQNITLSRKTFRQDSIQEVAEQEKIERIYYGEESGGSCLYGFSKNVEKKPYGISYFKESVQKYGGFYIARYETGDSVATKEREEAIEGKPVIQEGVYPYTYITRNDALEQAMQFYAENTEIVSSLINSYAWDTTLQFIQQTIPNYATSKEWGGTEQLQKTGQNQDCACNIYDLAGNIREWTTEYSSNGYYSYLSSCVVRGGYYENQDFTASSRYYNGEFIANAYIGYRMIIYI